MKTVYLTKEQGEPMARKFYPEYKGNKFSVRIQETYRFHDYWDGGSREYATLAVQDENGVLRSVSNPTAHHNPITQSEAHQETTIPKNGMIIEHCIFCGKDMGINFILSPDSVFLPLMLPESTETVPIAERIVLYSVCSLKNSYGGETNIRESRAVQETKITRDEYREAFKSCQVKGYLNKAGAVTVSGRNIVSGLYHWPKD